MSRLLNRLLKPYPEGQSNHHKAVIEVPNRLMHQKSNDFFQRT
jgi:hypothetical protein